ncbi:hypothetical protein [Streptomyces sannanensis]
MPAVARQSGSQTRHRSSTAANSGSGPRTEPEAAGVVAAIEAQLPT